MTRIGELMSLTLIPAPMADRSAADVRATQSAALSKRTDLPDQDTPAGAFARLMDSVTPMLAEVRPQPLVPVPPPVTAPVPAPAIIATAGDNPDQPFDSDPVVTDPTSVVSILLTPPEGQTLPVDLWIVGPLPNLLDSPPPGPDIKGEVQNPLQNPTLAHNAPGHWTHVDVKGPLHPPPPNHARGSWANLAAQSDIVPGPDLSLVLPPDQPDAEVVALGVVAPTGPNPERSPDPANGSGIGSTTPVAIAPFVARHGEATPPVAAPSPLPLLRAGPVAVLSSTVPIVLPAGAKIGPDGPETPQIQRIFDLVTQRTPSHLQMMPNRAAAETGVPVALQPKSDLTPGEPGSTQTTNVPPATRTGHPQLFAAYTALVEPGQPAETPRADAAPRQPAATGTVADGPIRAVSGLAPQGLPGVEAAPDGPRDISRAPDGSGAQPLQGRPAIPAMPLDLAEKSRIKIAYFAPVEGSFADSTVSPGQLVALSRHDPGPGVVDPAQSAAHGSRATAGHIATQLVQAAGQVGSGTTDITLNPRELGHVRLSLQVVDGTMFVTIAVERPETADLMRRHIDSLAQEFRGLGYQDVSFSFSGRQGGNGPGPDPGVRQGSDGAPTQPPETGNEQTTDRFIPRRAAAQTGGTGLDLRL